MFGYYANHSYTPLFSSFNKKIKIENHFTDEKGYIS
jgi:hypothetical protein